MIFFLKKNFFFFQLNVLLGLLAVLESLELAEVDALLQQIGRAKQQPQAVSGLVSLLQQRRSRVQDEGAREVLAKLAARLKREADGSRDGLAKTLQVAELHVQALARPFVHLLLDKAWFDPREGRAAAHDVAAVAVQNQGRELVERGRTLASLVGDVRDASPAQASELKRLVASLLGKARAHLSNGAEKAEMAEICRLLYGELAAVASSQRQEVQALLQKQYFAKGDLVTTLLRLSLIAVGSDESATTTSQLKYVWPPKKKQASKPVTASSPVKVVARVPPPSTTGNDSKLLPFMGVCVVCKEDVHGRVVKALNGVFHPDHFSCTACRRIIAVHESFMADPHQPLRPVCTACGAKALSQSSSSRAPVQSLPGTLGPCGTCGRGVTGQHVAALGKIYHAACLQCGQCGRTIGPSDPLARGDGGFPVCIKCSAGKPVVGGPAPVVSVSAKKQPTPPPPPPSASLLRVCGECQQDLGDNDALTDAGQFFHKECFVCCECRKGLGSDFFMSSGQRMCRECYKFAMFKCFACMLPLHKHGSDVQYNGHLYHLSCAPRGVAGVSAPPSQVAKKPLPTPVMVDSPLSSPPPSPPPVRPQWEERLSSSSSSSEPPPTPPARRPVDARDDLDDLVSEFLQMDEAPPHEVPLPAPLMRTSRASRASGIRVEACWSCGAGNPIDYIECLECGEAGLIAERGSEFSLPEEGEVVQFDDFNRRSSSVADEDQLSALILELGDI